ncbi:MAG: AIR synthase family protein [Clostridiales Family XIII bacterium]|jgi:hydrogenase expression/formation protein HypE|nr:AIR synthase family protein [Clostridiales Family XIII bacterium]
MLKIGKLDNELLEAIVLRHIRHRRPEVLTRPGIGDDCAVIDFGPYECVLSTDPITATAAQAGLLAIHVSCNDIASNGIAPLGVMLAVLLPEGTEEEEVREIMRRAAEAAEELNVEIIGGHTEITAAVTKPVIISTAIGRAEKGASQSAKDMWPGDFLLLTKQAGLEGTGILANDFAARLAGALSEAELREARSMLSRVSVVREGVIAGRIGTAGMHDVTEGGVLGAVWEMCEISGTGAELREDTIPVAAVTRKICAHFGLDSLRLISSGSMLIAARPAKKDALLAAIREAGVETACIGVVRERESGLCMVCGDGARRPVGPPGADEIYKVRGQI